jgi:hypothetical protein
MRVTDYSRGVHSAPGFLPTGKYRLGWYPEPAYD